jgi:hypothetical protein
MKLKSSSMYEEKASHGALNILFRTKLGAQFQNDNVLPMLTFTINL